MIRAAEKVAYTIEDIREGSIRVDERYEDEVLLRITLGSDD